MGERAVKPDPMPAARARVVRAKRRRVLIEDARRDGSYLRVTWHPEGQVFVVSTWREEVCTGAIRVPAAASADLAGLIVEGLADVVTSPAPAPAVGPWDAVQAKLRNWLHRGKVQAATLRVRPSGSTKARRRI